ncbi:MAG: ROK family protein [Oscillospiraceae bacterium]
MNTLGVDLGGTNIAAGMVDQTGEIIEKLSRPTESAGGGPGIAEQIIGLCRALCAQAAVEPTDLAGVGIAAAGWVDATTGVIRSSANLPFEDFAMAEAVGRQLGCPVRIDNDANCAALGEWAYGAAKGETDVLLLTVGTGIGAGVIFHGRLMTGPGVAELGHVVLEMGGELCGCGRRGCCEAYCSATALIRQATEAAQEDPAGLLAKVDKMTGKAVFDAAARGDETARWVLNRYFGYFAEMLMNFINCFRPRLVLIGGGVAGAEGAFFDPLREKLADVARANVYGVGMPEIRHAANGNDAGILGAAALLTQREEMR